VDHLQGLVSVCEYNIDVIAQHIARFVVQFRLICGRTKNADVILPIAIMIVRHPLTESFECVRGFRLSKC